MTDEAPPGPKRYRARAYDKNYEIQSDRVHLVVLDLDTPQGFRLAQFELESLRAGVARQQGLRGERALDVRLAIHSHPDGGYVMDWSARQ
jgi:hypothetical protein